MANNRERYWDSDYADYWIKVTNDAQQNGSERTSIKKLSGNDFKTPGIDIVESIFDRVEYNNADRLLDYGCGLGRFYPYLSAKTEYYGIDISKIMIERCKESFPESAGRFIVAEGENLPFENGFFDKIVCYGVFDACYQEEALLEILRVSHEGTYIIISGKNTNYYMDDEEALIAEENARIKGHPNFFTDVKEMFSQLTPYVDIYEEWYALRRGDFGMGIFVKSMPDLFYEWIIILRRTDRDKKTAFNKFSYSYSSTWKRIKE